MVFNRWRVGALARWRVGALTVDVGLNGPDATCNLTLDGFPCISALFFFFFRVQSSALRISPF
jgi:hypothetical protein